MPYPTVTALEQLWKSFENKIENISNPIHDHLSDIKKLMTAVSVIDLSLHDIYLHAEYVHELTEKFINLKNTDATNNDIKASCQLWLDILKQRNQIPLKIKHHQLLDGECDFRFSLQLMDGNNPHGFKEVQVLDPKNNEDIKEAIAAIHRLDCVAEGISFAKLPLMNDTLLSDILTYQNTICLLAKDQNNQIIGHCWGILLKDVAIANKQKVNVFWVLGLAKDPDFFDSTIKVGDQLRTKMVEILTTKNDCDFVGYQHILNHSFHMGIISSTQNDNEKIRINNQERPARTTIEYDDTLGLFVRTHLIKTNDNNNTLYPEYSKMHAELVNAFKQAIHSFKDFMFGFISFFGRIQYQKLTHSMLENSHDERLVNQISHAKDACDKNILKEIILSKCWEQQGITLFCSTHVPNTMQQLQSLAQTEELNFKTIKSFIDNSGINLMRSKLTTLFYKVISIADSPTFALNSLLKNKETPKEWVDLITQQRKLVLNNKPALSQ